MARQLQGYISGELLGICCRYLWNIDHDVKWSCCIIPKIHLHNSALVLQLIWCPHLPRGIYNNLLSDRHRGSAQFTIFQFSPIPNRLYWVFSLPASSCPCLSLMCIPIAGDHGKVLLWMGHLTHFIMYFPTLSNLAPLHHWKILLLCSATHVISLITRDFYSRHNKPVFMYAITSGHHGMHRQSMPPWYVQMSWNKQQHRHGNVVEVTAPVVTGDHVEACL